MESGTSVDAHPLFDPIVETVKLLRKPVGHEGPLPALGSRDWMEHVGRTYNLIHLTTIDMILHIEEQLRTSPRDRALLHVRQVLRTINDALVWLILGEDADFLVRRLSLGKSRGYLADQNASAVLGFLRYVTKDGNSVAIWTDATRCVDVDDIILLSQTELKFIELKEGRVNEDILELLKTPLSPEAIDSFVQKYPRHGLDQLTRTIKQGITGHEHLEFVGTDNITNPFTGTPHMATREPISRCAYDGELSAALIAARSRPTASLTVDDCLHILIVNPRLARREEMTGDFVREMLRAQLGQRELGHPDLMEALTSLDFGFDRPEAMPLMLRGFEPEDIARICLRGLQVYFVLDFDAWGRKLKNSRFAWSTPKEARRESSRPLEERALVIDGRIPQVVDPNGRSWNLGGAMLGRIINEGTRPNDLARAYDTILFPGHDGP